MAIISKKDVDSCKNSKRFTTYRDNITGFQWMYCPEIRLIKYNIDMQINNWNIPEKRNNPFFYCYLNKTPGAEIRVGEKIYPVTPGTIMLIPPNLEHSPHQTAPFNHSFIHFIALPPFDSLRSITQIPAEKYVHLFRRHENEYKTALALYSLVFQLLLEIPEDHFCSGQIRDDRIFKASRLLSLYCHQNLQLKEIAEKLNMSVSSFCHLFKEETGFSPIHYAMERRLEKALMLLADEDMSIKDIAEKTGFSDRYHFSKVFKNRYGSTPVQMRKRLSSFHTSGR